MCQSFSYPNVCCRRQEEATHLIVTLQCLQKGSCLGLTIDDFNYEFLYFTTLGHLNFCPFLCLRKQAGMFMAILLLWSVAIGSIHPYNTRHFTSFWERNEIGSYLKNYFCQLIDILDISYFIERFLNNV